MTGMPFTGSALFRVAAVLAGALLIAAFGLVSPAYAQNDDRDGDGTIECCERGDIFCGVGRGQVQQRNPNGGALIRTLNTASGSFAETGMCFDATGDLHTTNFTHRTASKLDTHSDPLNTNQCGTLLVHPFAGPFSVQPEDCVFNAAGDVYFGEVDGLNRLQKFNPAGGFLQSWNPATGPRGLDWFDLAADQCTFFYTSEGYAVKRFDVCANGGLGMQLADFRVGLAGPCYALRIIPAGPFAGDVLVACTQQVYHLQAGTGATLFTQPRAGFCPGSTSFFFAMNLDPSGTTYWTADISSGAVCEFQIGVVGPATRKITCPPLGSSTTGLALCGEHMASQPMCPEDPAPLGQGYWHRQCLGVPAGPPDFGIDPGRNGRGPQSPTEPDFVKTLIPAVDAELQARIFVFHPCSEGMAAEPPSDKCEKAIKQYTALLFNLESGRLGPGCEVDLSAESCSSTNVGDLLDELAALINSGDPDNCNKAAACADAVNTGAAVSGSGSGSTQQPQTEETPVSAVQTEAIPEIGAEAPILTAADPAAFETIPTEEVTAETAKVPASPIVVIEDPASLDSPEAAGEEDPEPDDPLLVIRRQMAVFENGAAPDSARSSARDALLTALGGGYDLDTRLEIVTALLGEIDVAYESLLGKHLVDIRDQALELGMQDIADEAERLMKRLEASEREGN